MSLQAQIPCSARPTERVRSQFALLALTGGHAYLIGLDDVDALKELDPIEARVVVMRFLVGMPTEEIGLVLGLSPATVQRHRYGARAWLKSCL